MPPCSPPPSAFPPSPPLRAARPSPRAARPPRPALRPPLSACLPACLLVCLVLASCLPACLPAVLPVLCCLCCAASAASTASAAFVAFVVLVVCAAFVAAIGPPTVEPHAAFDLPQCHEQFHNCEDSFDFGKIENNFCFTRKDFGVPWQENTYTWSLVSHQNLLHPEKKHMVGKRGDKWKKGKEFGEEEQRGEGNGTGGEEE